MHHRIPLLAVLSWLAPASSLAAQAAVLSPAVQPFVTINAPVVAITGVRLVDGTGTPARTGQTVVLTGDRITAVGPAGQVTVPAGARTIDGAGHTLIPGFVGLHDHLYYSQVMIFSYPKLFLATGVTTIRTTGSRDSYQELNLRAAIEAGETVGPAVFVTGPYLQGAGRAVGWMHPLNGPEDARRLVRYWAEEGVQWFKAYTLISRTELGAAIDEAHRHGVKVTGHLCSVGFREAVALGIDNIEHGLDTNSEFLPGKQPDACPAGGDSVYARLDMRSPEVQQTIRDMVARGVSLTSTLAVNELATPTRIPRDQRVLDALHPGAAQSVQKYWDDNATRNDSVSRAVLRNIMAFEREFVKAGGLLGAGSDPCCLSAIAGYADQRNFEMLVEAGFTGEQAVQVMSANGARILGIADRVGTIAPGLQADLVLLRGDPVRTPADIRNVALVFRKGLGYDPEKLTAAVRGQVGLR
jgi:imidazolonepropionase-like amidohydrolase